MKGLFVCGKETSYVRNMMLFKGFAHCGCEIIDCSSSSSTYVVRTLVSIVRFLLVSKKEYDFILIGCLGHHLVLLLRHITKKKIVFDPFVSTFDTVCFDRKRFKPDSRVGKLCYWLDSYSCRQADLVLLDTDAHINYFTETFDLPRGKFHRVFVGADESIFFPRDDYKNSNKFRVFYYSSFLPLHGTEFIVQAAARLCEQSDIEFVIVGTGMEHTRICALAQSLCADNIRFIDWLPYEQLPLEIAQADICLGGHFSNSDKAKRVIAGKTFQFLAMKKPVIVGDCVGNRELLCDRENALFVTMADAASLADGIMELKENIALRMAMADEGYKTYMERGTTSVTGETLRHLLIATTQAR